jgi:hypothetical protein
MDIKRVIKLMNIKEITLIINNLPKQIIPSQTNFTVELYQTFKEKII